MIARNPKWQNIYDLAVEINNWPLDYENYDRIRFAKWCQFYHRLNENYEEEERPDDRRIWYDVIVDDFLKRQKEKKQLDKRRQKMKHGIKDIQQGDIVFG
jgi:hypothetical protein